MPETRYVEEYKDGVLVESTPYVVSDAQLLLESLAGELNSHHTQVLQALDNWGSLTLAQKDQLLKLLAKFYILAGDRLGVFHL